MFSLHEPKIATCVLLYSSSRLVLGLYMTLVVRTSFPLGATSIKRSFTHDLPPPLLLVVLNTSLGIGGRGIGVAFSLGQFFSVNYERLHDSIRSYNSEVGYLVNSFHPMKGNS